MKTLAPVKHFYINTTITLITIRRFLWKNVINLQFQLYIMTAEEVGFLIIVIIAIGVVAIVYRGNQQDVINLDWVISMSCSFQLVRTLLYWLWEMYFYVSSAEMQIVS